MRGESKHPPSKQIPEENPLQAADIFARAFAQFQSGQLSAALAECRAGLAQDPNQLEGWHLLALIWQTHGQPEQAFGALQKSLELALSQPESQTETVPPLYTTLGNFLSEVGEMAAAEQAYLTAFNQNPAYLPARLNLARLREERGNVLGAEAAYTGILTQNPWQFEALIGLGELFRRQQRWPEAHALYHRAGTQASFSRLEQARLWTQWGVVHSDQGQLEMAETAQKKALDAQPLADTWFNLGSLYQEQGRFDEARTAYRQALQLEPHLAEAHLNTALLDLATEQWESGFAGLSWRHHCLDWQGTLLQPRWQGEPLQGQKLRVQGEYGQGDIILFARYLKALAAQAAEVQLSCPASLAPLLTHLGIVCVAPNAAEPTWDKAVHLMDLPHLLKLTPQTTDCPYLGPFQAAAFKGLTPKDAFKKEGLKIGFCWHGQRPEDHNLPTAQRMARRKMLPLNRFADLAARFSDVEFCSLQWPAEPEKLAQYAHLTDLSGQIQTWKDTANLIQSLDLIISADTALAHLAGAMHKPVWVLLPTPVYWFWPPAGTDFAWYPQMRLFHQTRSGDWDGVFGEIQQALAERLKELNPRL